MTRTLLAISLLASCSTGPAPVAQEEKAGGPPADSIRGWDSTLVLTGERHFKRIKQLTFGGDNAEAYWSFDGSRLVFQSTNPNWGESCDQIHVFDPFKDELRTGQPQRISVNGGRTTCSYFLPGDSLILFASTHEHDASCPTVPERRADGKGGDEEVTDAGGVVDRVEHGLAEAAAAPTVVGNFDALDAAIIDG